MPLRANIWQSLGRPAHRVPASTKGRPKSPSSPADTTSTSSTSTDFIPTISTISTATRDAQHHDLPRNPGFRQGLPGTRRTSTGFPLVRCAARRARCAAPIPHRDEPHAPERRRAQPAPRAGRRSVRPRILTTWLEPGGGRSASDRTAGGTPVTHIGGQMTHFACFSVLPGFPP